MSSYLAQGVKKYDVVFAWLLHRRFWNHRVFQFTGIPWPTLAIMTLAIINGLLTSIALETFILSRQMSLKLAFNTAIGMSIISMVSMEAAMNIVDVLLTGGAMLTWWVVPIMLLAGFLTPLPYNYWRLKALGKSCH